MAGPVFPMTAGAFDRHTANMLAVLRVIRDGVGTRRLLRKGLEYAQIAQLISEAIAEQLLQETSDSLTLTEKGSDYLRTNRPHNKDWLGNGWVGPLEEARIPKVPIDAVYLPELSLLDVWRRIQR